MTKEQEKKVKRFVRLKKYEKVLFKPTKTIYDYGYIGWTGYIIVYTEGEKSMQDAHAISPDDLIIMSERKNKLKRIIWGQ